MFDLAIIGSGFGGSLLSLIASRLGRRVLLLEKGRHPRFVIGESSTPLADLIWLDLCKRYDLPRLAPFAKWGTWRASYPEISCGLKRGFSFFHHPLGNAFEARPDKSDQLLVAASPRDEIADTHWYRPEFDQFLAQEAARCGVEYLEECEVTDVSVGPASTRLGARCRGAELHFDARFVVDAGSGHGPLARVLGLPVRALSHMPETHGLYTHFAGVRRLVEMPIHPDVPRAPFGVDDAAVHHVFEGGWIWVLRFANGITSAGVAARSSIAARFDFAAGEQAWLRLLDQLPTVACQFEKARPLRPFIHAPRLSFHVTTAAAEKWALLPSAAGFVDPLLSSGFILSLLGIERLAAAMENAWNSPTRWSAALSEYAEETREDLYAIERFVAAFYACMEDFERFTELARLYFCAVVHGETLRRLGRPSASFGYLLRRKAEFETVSRRVCEQALRGASASDLRQNIEPLLERFDVGGFWDSARRPWYPVLAGDLVQRRECVGATEAEVDRLLRSAGFLEVFNANGR